MSSKLPFISSNIPKDLRTFLDRVRESLFGTGVDRALTVKDLVDAGIVGVTPSGTVTSPGGVVGTPPTPTNFTATGALANIILTWDPPVYNGHAYAEIWTSGTDNLGEAVLLAVASGASYSDNVGSSATKYYWIRFVNVLGTAGKFNSTDGTLGQTGDDPAYLLDVLTGSITTSELSEALATEIETNTTEITSARNLYTVKMDNNGFVTGFGLLSTLSDGGLATSDFFVNVNRFAITAPMTTIPIRANSTAYAVNNAVRIVGTDDKILVCKVAGTSASSAPSIAVSVGSLVSDGSVIWQVASSVPFAVLSSSLTANGNTLAPGVYIDGASIVNATIGNAQIANASIDNAKIADLSVEKLTAGSIATGQYIQSSNYVSGSQGFRINANGSAEFSDITARGAVFATSGEFTGTVKVGTTILGGVAESYNVGTGLFAGLDSSTYKFRVGNPSGARLEWNGSYIYSQNADATKLIDMGASGANPAIKFGTQFQVTGDGAATFSGTTTGTLDVKSAASGARLELKNNVIKVFDSTGTLRVQIGDLSA
jgi:hypothetical protein